MQNVRRLVPAIDYKVRALGGQEYEHRAKRYLRDLQMLGLGPAEIAETLRELLDTVEPGAVDWSRA